MSVADGAPRSLGEIRRLWTASTIDRPSHDLEERLNHLPAIVAGWLDICAKSSGDESKDAARAVPRSFFEDLKKSRYPEATLAAMRDILRARESSSDWNPARPWSTEELSALTTHSERHFPPAFFADVAYYLRRDPRLEHVSAVSVNAMVVEIDRMMGRGRMIDGKLEGVGRCQLTVELVLAGEMAVGTAYPSPQIAALLSSDDFQDSALAALDATASAHLLVERGHALRWSLRIRTPNGLDPRRRMEGGCLGGAFAIAMDQLGLGS